MIICIWGNPSCGKTLLQTFLTLERKKEESDLFIYSNYTLNKIPYKRLNVIQDMENIKTKKNFIDLDEAWISADARTTGQQGNIDFSRVILQSMKAGEKNEKRETNLIYTTQKLRQIDTRIKGVTNLYIHPQIILKDNDDIPIVIKAYSFIPNIQGDLIPYSTALFYVYGSHKFYDTHERITPIYSTESDTLLKEFENFSGNKKELKSVLVKEKHLNKSDAEIQADYIVHCLKQRIRDIGIET